MAFFRNPNKGLWTLVQKNSTLMLRLKKCHFGNFSEWAGMTVPCCSGPQQSLTRNKKIFLIWVTIIF
jgi:hypothetical protein